MSAPPRHAGIVSTVIGNPAVHNVAIDGDVVIPSDNAVIDTASRTTVPQQTAPQQTVLTETAEVDDMSAKPSTSTSTATVPSAVTPLVTSVTLVEPMPGFEDDTAFTLSAIDDNGVLASLRSVRDPDLRFVVTPAEVFFADYRDSLMPLLTAPVLEAVGADPDADPATTIGLYLLLTIGTSLADTTANLRAPIAVDEMTGRAVQVILDDDTLPVRQPLPIA